MTWFVLCAYLWPAPVELWDVKIEPTDTALQKKLHDELAKGVPGYLFHDPAWIHDA